MTSTKAPDVEALQSQMLDILERLDALDLDQAAAHLTMAIHCLRPGSFDCPPPEPVK